MKSYPYIGKDNYGQIYLILSSSDAITMDSDSFTHTPMEEGGYKNITPEFLQNTYGEVVWPEHAEFIAELCESNGIELFNHYDEGITHFAINRGEIIFTYGKPAISDHDKQITIPLPPKQIQTATPEEEFEMKQIMKNAGDNLVLGCEDSKCDEWPKVGDEVLVYSSTRRLAEIKGKAVEVIGKCTHSDGSTIITVEHSSLGVFAVAKESCIKPKTPEEELRDDIVQTIYNDVYQGTYEKQYLEVFASVLMSKYNITKKPQ